MVRDSLLNLVKKFKPVNDKLSYLTITGKVFDIVMINCYVPTEILDGDLRDAYYKTLEITFYSIPRYAIKFVIGDTKAQVGQERIFQKTAGKESFHLESINNGLRLINFAASKDLMISSTMFQ